MYKLNNAYKNLVFTQKYIWDLGHYISVWYKL